MKSTLAATLAAIAFIGTPIAATLTVAMIATPALADHNSGGHGGHSDASHASHAQAAISHDRAVEIATAQGIATIREVELEDGKWEVEGATAEGRRIEVEINADNGAVVKREIY